MDQTKGEEKSGPYTDYEGYNEKGLIHQINNASILAELKMEIMQ